MISQFSKLSFKARSKLPWETKELEILKMVFKNFGLSKLEFAAKLLKRDGKEVLQKWFDIIHASEVEEKVVKRTVWTEQDDAKLIHLAKEFGKDTKNWSSVSINMKDKSLRQCRERWKCIKQKLKKRWATEEEERIVALVSKYGPKWESFEHFFSNRSQHSIKTHYYIINKLPKYAKVAEMKEKLDSFSGLAAKALSEHRQEKKNIKEC